MERVVKAKQALKQLHKFCDLDIRRKLCLVKALVVPVLTYPAILMHVLSRVH